MSDDRLKIIRELTLNLGDVPIHTALAALDRHAKTPWRRDTVMEQRLAAPGADVMYCFNHESGANLWLRSQSGRLTVANIIPTHVGRLPVAAYNALIEDFNRAVIAPTTAELGIAPAELTPGEVTLEEWLGSTAADKLRTFSAFANKATQASHPADQRRWNDFVYTAHREGRAIDSYRLQQWLVQNGWLDSDAYDLAVQYEQALALLDFASENVSHAAR